MKKCAVAYPHIGKDRLLISEESTTCHFGVHFSIKKPTALTLELTVHQRPCGIHRDKHIVLFPQEMWKAHVDNNGAHVV